MIGIMNQVWGTSGYGFGGVVQTEQGAQIVPANTALYQQTVQSMTSYANMMVKGYSQLTQQIYDNLFSGFSGFITSNPLGAFTQNHQQNNSLDMGFPQFNQGSLGSSTMSGVPGLQNSLLLTGMLGMSRISPTQNVQFNDPRPVLDSSTFTDAQNAQYISEGMAADAEAAVQRRQSIMEITQGDPYMGMFIMGNLGASVLPGAPAGMYNAMMLTGLYGMTNPPIGSPSNTMLLPGFN